MGQFILTFTFTFTGTRTYCQGLAAVLFVQGFLLSGTSGKRKGLDTLSFFAPHKRLTHTTAPTKEKNRAAVFSGGEGFERHGLKVKT